MHSGPRAIWPCSPPTSTGTRRCSRSATRSRHGCDDPLLHARIKECRGQATLYQGDIPGAIELLEQARREFQALADPLGEFDTLILLTACHLLPRRPEGRRVQPAGAGARGGPRRPVVHCVRPVGGRYREVAGGRLRSGDGVPAEVGAAVPAAARPDGHQLRRPGPVLVRLVRRAGGASGAAAGCRPGRVAHEWREGRRDDGLQRLRPAVQPTRCGRRRAPACSSRRPSSRPSRRVRPTPSTRPCRSLSVRRRRGRGRTTTSTAARAGRNGRADPARARGLGAARRGAEQQGHRSPARHRPAHRRDPRGSCPREGWA